MRAIVTGQIGLDKKAYLDEVAAFVPKPYEPEELANAVRSALES